MKVINKTTGITEFNGNPDDFVGIEFIDTFTPKDGEPQRRNDEYEIVMSDDDKRQVVTKRITDKVPLSSLVGTAADAATAFTLVQAVGDIAKDSVEETPEIRAYKDGMNNLMNADNDADGWDKYIIRCKQYLADVKAKKVIIPFMVKYGTFLPVFDDVGERNTLVAMELAKDQPTPAAES